MPRRAGQPTIHGQVRTRLLNGESIQSVLAFVRTLTSNSWYSLRNLERMRQELHGEVSREAVRETVQQEVRQTQRTNSNVGLAKGIDSELSFGIEIEFLRKVNISQRDIALKLRANGINIQVESWNHTTREHWKLTTDSSVRSHNSNYEGRNELVSPILKGEDGLNQVITVCKVLDELGCSANKSCGLHVHHGLNHLERSEAITTIKKIIMVYKKFQNYFNAMLPKSRRNAYYARTFKTQEISSLKTYGDVQRFNRYKVVNPNSFWSHGTIEFRQHSGTVDYEKAINWIKITQRIVKTAMEIPSNEMWEHSFKSFHKEFVFPTEVTKYIKERIKKFRNVA